MFYTDKVMNKQVVKSDFLGDINHFFTTRELILKTKESDDKVALSLNYRRELKEIFQLEYLVTSKQIHSDNIEIVKDGIVDYPDSDALILADFKNGIFLNFADCVPIILYDSNNNIASIVHSGWRGTVKQIVKKTVLKMKNDFNSNPKDIIGVIGPCICYKCFETSEEIMYMLEKSINDSSYCEYRNGKCYANLPLINKIQLNQAGVEKIDVSPFCTCCNNDMFPSYRKNQGTTDRLSAFITLKS